MRTDWFPDLVHPRSKSSETAPPRGVLADHLVTFAPWIAYIVLIQVTGSWRLGFVVGLAVSAGVVAWRAFCRDSRFMDVGTLCYCAAMSAISLTFPSSPLRAFNVPLSLGVVGVLSSLTLVFPPPFTYRTHRGKVPDWILDDRDLHGRMMQVHRVATGSWALAQILAGVFGAALVAANFKTAVVAVEVIGTVVPVGVTRTQHLRFLTSAGSRGEGAVAERDAVTGEDRGTPCRDEEEPQLTGGELELRSERPADVDIAPSFPGPSPR